MYKYHFEGHVLGLPAAKRGHAPGNELKYMFNYHFKGHAPDMTWACPGYASGMSEAMNLNTCIKAFLRGMPRHAQVCPRHTPSNNLKYMYKYHFEGHALGLPGA